MPDRQHRSVLDYDTEESLRRALMAVELNDDDDDSTSASTGVVSVNHHTTASSTSRILKPPRVIITENTPVEQYGDLDWVLSLYDPETSESQSVKEELKRLQVLKSYRLLEAQQEDAFDRITALATRVFHVPIALVTLIDLGRQWFMSSRGLGELKETPRKVSFCAHAILSKSRLMVVTDASKDFRFKDNPFVIAPQGIRFYAGITLLCPEGYKLGTFCIVDVEPRPEGLTMDEEATLTDLADMVMETMITRRTKLQTQENPAQLIAYTAHDLMTPLTGVQLSLSLLKEDEDVRRKLDPHQGELLSTAAACSDLMLRICENAMEGVRRGSAENVPPVVPTPHEPGRVPVTKMDELLKSLETIMDPIPKKVPLILQVNSSVPPMVLSDDLKLFRAALNLLSSAASRTEDGYIKFQIYPNDDNGELMFECEDTAPDVPVEEYQLLYQACRPDDGTLRISLSSVASLISSLDGMYGFRPRISSGQRAESGSIFWFSVPLIAPDSSEAVGINAGTSFAFVGRPFPKRNTSNGYRKEPIICAHEHEEDDDSVSQPAAAYQSNLSPMSATSAPRSPFRVRRRSDAAAMNGSHQPSAASTTSSIGSHSGDGAPRQRSALVVDDSLVVRKSIAMALKKLGFDVVQALNGLEGLKLMKEKSFDVVLCDFLMPVMDGFDCVRQLRQWEGEHRRSFRQLIIGISAHANGDVASQGIEAGMDDFKHKPIGIKTLTEINESESVRRCSRQLDELEGMTPVPSVASASRRFRIVPPPAHQDGEELSEARKRDSDDEESVSDNSATAKRARTTSISTSERLCLIAASMSGSVGVDVLNRLESHGWRYSVVNDGAEALEMMKKRNWDAILLENELTPISGIVCMNRFREWEHGNRVNRQKNAFFMSHASLPSPTVQSCVVQAPSGFDGVLPKPVVWKDLKYLLDRGSEDLSMSIVMKGS